MLPEFFSEVYYEFGETGVFLKKNNKRNCDNKSKHESQMVIALYPQGLLHRYLVYTKDLAKDQDVLMLPVFMVSLI